MKILMVGDIVGSPGRRAFTRLIPGMRASGKVDFVVVNAENSAGGRGLTPLIAEELLDVGADIITLGDHAWDQREMVSGIGALDRVVRPANFSPGCPGRGHASVSVEGFGNITVISVIGRVFMKPCDCPLRAIDRILKNEIPDSSLVLCEIHAEATSEKIIFGRYVDGRVGAVVGTHTHVQTSDETLLPNGTAYITDLGMTGPKDSAIGRDLASCTDMMLTGMPVRFDVAKDNVALEGVIIEFDNISHKAVSITRVREFID
ncbi:MAG: TIGR00282 family metallophosphoesterase [Verrucomicrobia bacterium]|nr:TIGR00282 family metallophosphoesterase [Verrucomicrobiota bacterium]